LDFLQRRFAVIYPRTKVQERRLEVTTLLVRGVPPTEIANILEVSRHTVYNDIRYIRSGKNEALVAHTRREIIAQLYLNVQARKRYLWNLAETARSEHASVQAMRELRLNDEHIVNKLPGIGDPEDAQEDDFDRKAMAAQLIHYKEQFEALKQRVDALKKRRLGMEATLRDKLDRGDYDGLRSWLSDPPDQPAD